MPATLPSAVDGASGHLATLRRRLFGPRSDPESQKMLSQVLHARSSQTFPRHRVPEIPDHRTPLLVIMPQFRLQPVGRRMRLDQRRSDTLNLILPVMSLLGVPLDVIENALFRAVKAHAANLFSIA